MVFAAGPLHAQVAASPKQSLKFTVATTTAAPAPAIGSNNFPVMRSPTTTQTSLPVAAPIYVAPQQPAQPQQDPNQQQQNASDMMKMMQSMLGNGGGGGQRDKSGEPDNQEGAPDDNTDWKNYSYPDGYKFNSGEKGAGNIGNGLCTENNSGRSQVKNGYCQMLSEILRDPSSCANHAMNRILDEAGSNGSGIGDLNHYCSDFSQLQDSNARSMVFMQVLSGLITKESGWNAHATEPSWSKNGHEMGGKGLFQIGVSDRGQDSDCSGINSSSIYDAKTNLKCGSCIALKNLAKDHTMGHGSGDSGARGLARYFGPFRDMQSNKRNDIARATNAYCQANVGGSGGHMAPVGGSATSNN